MKSNSTRNAATLRKVAFTLIELLVVIAVIGILAALIVPVGRGIKNKEMKSVAMTELHEIETAINSYHDNGRLGSYPPDNPTNSIMNPLYFELGGTVRSGPGPTFTTLDGSGRITSADAQTYFGVGGFPNSSTSAQGTDDAPAPVNFIKDLKPNQIGAVPDPASPIKILVCSVGWPLNWPSQPLPYAADKGVNPWNYVSTNPTNNPGSFDLWVDLIIDKKTNRISNWSTTPQIVP